MGSSLKKLKRLKGRGLRELRVRGAQSAHAFVERSGWSSQVRVPGDAAFYRLLDSRQIDRTTLSAETFLDHFCAQRQHFFAAFDDVEATDAELHRRASRLDADALKKRAEGVIKGRFDLLGLRDVSFGDPLDWHLEPLSGKRAPLKHWSRIDYLNAEIAGDKKIIWELNRQQHFMVLGRAYRHTRDERYAEAFAAQLASWMDANPPKLGINWASSLEVAFRSISWLWGIHFFRDSPRLTPELFLRAVKYLYLHARHLETYLSTYFSPNTHLTGEALGLYYLGVAFPAFRASARWRETGRRVLLDELARQVRPDGTYFEQATYYQRYTADFYTHFYLLARAHGEPVEALLKERVCAMLDFLMHVTRPDGTTPFFGDDDGGRLAWLGERAPGDFRATLSIGAALFGRADYKHVAGDEAAEETLWLMGSEGLRAFDRLGARRPVCDSRAFVDGGFYVMRDGWTEASDYLMIDCGPHGSLSCGHAHADALSFDLAAGGRTLVIDPGTYTYTGSAAERDYFRSSAAHNALVVDGESSSVPGTAFTWKHVAHCQRKAWVSRPRFDFFEGAHDGYARLDLPAHVARAVLFLKGDYWIVRDRIETKGTHRYDTYLHFAPGTELSVETRGASCLMRAAAESGQTGFEIHGARTDGAWRVEKNWVSPCYGLRERAPVGVRACEGEGAQDFISFLVPCTAVEMLRGRRLREIEAAGGRAFEFEGEMERDVLLVGDGMRLIETAHLSSNFSWAWVRFHAKSKTPSEFVLVGGRQLSLGGETIVDAGASSVSYCSARRVGNALEVETDAEEFLDIETFGAQRVVMNEASSSLRGGHVARFRGGTLCETDGEERALAVDVSA